MSYDIYLADPVTKEVIQAETEHYIRGGTYCLGGENTLTLNVTYNYSPIFKKVFGDTGIHILEDKTGAESISILKAAISKLKDDIADDYWAPTEGNAKRALCGLLAFAQMRPDGIWKIN